MMAQLSSLAQENQATRVTRVTVEIGVLAGVVVDSFRFGFEVLSAEDPLVRGAELEVLSIPATYRCTRCGGVEVTAERPDSCPQCGEIFLIPEGGDELVLRQVEME